MAGVNGGAPEDVPEDLRQLSYYFSHFTSLEEVVKLLSYHIEVNGAFILRNSIRRSGFLTLSVVHNMAVKHIKIGVRKGCYYLSNKKFSCVSDLVDHYSKEDVPNVEKVAGIRLTHPIMAGDDGQHDDTWVPVDNSDPFTTHNSALNGRGKVERSTSSPALQRPAWGSSSPGGIPRRKSGPEPLPGSPDPGIRDIRPPPPPPPPPPGSDLSGLEYDEVRPIHVDHTKELIYHLRSSERCECGLYVQDAMLPLRWAVHLTGNPTGPKAFFVDPDNQSHWKLPKHVRDLLEPHQKLVLQKYGV